MELFNSCPFKHKLLLFFHVKLIVIANILGNCIEIDNIKYLNSIVCLQLRIKAFNTQKSNWLIYSFEPIKGVINLTENQIKAFELNRTLN